MTVKIVTDSTSDIPQGMADRLGIEIVPGYVKFGKDTYRDGIEMNNDEFYRMLIEYPLPPTTQEASVQDFAQVYKENQYTPDGIVSIHVSSRISKMYESAQKGAKKAKPAWPLEVLDSRLASIGLGLAVIHAARLAREEKTIQEITREARKSFQMIEMLGLFDTLKYASRGGKVTRQIAELSAVRRVKPLLTFRDGEIVEESMVNSFQAGIDKLVTFLNSPSAVEDVGIAYTTANDAAREIKERLSSVFPKDRIHLTQMGAVLGSHCGPDALFVAKRRGV